MQIGSQEFVSSSFCICVCVSYSPEFSVEKFFFWLKMPAGCNVKIHFKTILKYIIHIYSISNPFKSQMLSRTSVRKPLE